jgi:hypothetical protein
MCAVLCETSKHAVNLSQQLQDLYIDVALLSETYLKRHKRFFIPNYHFYRTDCFLGRKSGTVIAVRKGIPHNHVLVDLSPLASIEAIEVCIPIGNSEMLLAPGHAWNDTDIIELLSFRQKLLLAGDLNATNPFWNSAVSNLQA